MGGESMCFSDYDDDDANEQRPDLFMMLGQFAQWVGPRRRRIERQCLTYLMGIHRERLWLRVQTFATKLLACIQVLFFGMYLVLSEEKLRRYFMFSSIFNYVYQFDSMPSIMETCQMHNTFKEESNCNLQAAEYFDHYVKVRPIFLLALALVACMIAFLLVIAFFCFHVRRNWKSDYGDELTYGADNSPFTAGQAAVYNAVYHSMCERVTYSMMSLSVVVISFLQSLACYSVRAHYFDSYFIGDYASLYIPRIVSFARGTFWLVDFEVVSCASIASVISMLTAFAYSPAWQKADKFGFYY